jgi:hypothetical protein
MSFADADDVWSLNLTKLDGWKPIKENTAGEDAFRELSDSEWESNSQDEASD